MSRIIFSGLNVFTNKCVVNVLDDVANYIFRVECLDILANYQLFSANQLVYCVFLCFA